MDLKTLGFSALQFYSSGGCKKTEHPVTLRSMFLIEKYEYGIINWNYAISAA